MSSSNEHRQGDARNVPTVVIVTVDNVVEAELARDALQDEGIECVLESFADTAFDGALTAGKGWGAVRVAMADEARARSIVEAALEPMHDVDEDDSDATDVEVEVDVDKELDELEDDEEEDDLL